MRTETRMPNPESRIPIRSWLSVLVIAATAVAGAVGCGTSSSKGQLYCVTGKVVDAATRLPLANAQLRLMAAVNVDVDVSRLPRIGETAPTGSGVNNLTGVGRTAPDGTYELKLARGFDVMRRARRIHIEAGMPGYEVSGVDVPVPTVRKDEYEAPTIFLTRRMPTGSTFTPGPPGTPPSEKPIPWQ
jgi:hypothetical protein